MIGVQSWRFELETDRTTVGKSAENDIALPDDPTASHLHAIVERFPAGWCVTDLGSSNGTWVNGERIWSSRRLRHADEIRVGQSRSAPVAASARAVSMPMPDDAPVTIARRPERSTPSATSQIVDSAPKPV